MQTKKQYSREELIAICQDAVVPCEKWRNRDSRCSQVQISDIHALLCVGAEFEIGGDTDDYTIWICFKNLTDEQKAKRLEYRLAIDSREDYFKKCDPNYESEMFESDGIDVNCLYEVYMPTRERLEQVKGEDWY